MTDRTCSIDGCERPRHAREWCHRHYWHWQTKGDPLAGFVSAKPSKTLSVADTFRFYMPGDPPPEGVPWIWNGTVTNQGYGVFQVSRKVYRAHRVAYELFVGPIPPGLMIRHKNDRRSDVNPHNLIPGTAWDNMNDKVERSRQARGSKHGWAKLTEGEILAIRAAHQSGMSQREIGRRWGISHIHVGRIVRREVWAHVAAIV